jgi:glycosyltransferase involved in cell wall biosynthesis
METERISVVVPVYNEAESISELQTALSNVCRAHFRSYEIIFVNDGSQDGTPALLKSFAQADPCVRVLSLKRNFGQSAALSAGFDHASGDYVVTLDGDLQNDPADIPALVAKCREGSFDLVNGWRKIRRDPLLSKKIPSWFANRLIRKMTGVNIHDTGCTLKVFRRGVLSDLHLYGEMHRFIPALLHWTGASIGEMAVAHHPRKHGKSKYSLGKLPRVVLDLLNIKFLISYSTRPIQIFGKVGFYAMTGGLLSLLILIFMKTRWGVDMTGNPFLLLTVFMEFIGVQFITMGLLGEIVIRTYHETTRKKIYQIAEKA